MRSLPFLCRVDPYHPHLTHTHTHTPHETVFRRNYYRAYWFEALTIGKPPEMSWGRYLRKRTAAATGFHNFFSNSTIARRLQDSQAYKCVFHVARNWVM